MQRARRKDEHRREREAQEQRLRAARDAERAEKASQAGAARQAALREKQVRLEVSERLKRDVKTIKAREKLQRERAKRRAAFKSQIKRRLAFVWKQAR